MFGRLTKGAVLLILFAMIVVYAVQAASSGPSEPEPIIDRIYS